MPAGARAESCSSSTSPGGIEALPAERDGQPHRRADAGRVRPVDPLLPRRPDARGDPLADAAAVPGPGRRARRGDRRDLAAASSPPSIATTTATGTARSASFAASAWSSSSTTETFDVHAAAVAPAERRGSSQIGGAALLPADADPDLVSPGADRRRVRRLEPRCDLSRDCTGRATRRCSAHTEAIDDFVRQWPLPRRRAKRDALRALRGSILRTELYALDGTDRENRPYTVTESRSTACAESRGSRREADGDRTRIFFPHALASAPPSGSAATTR